MKVQQLSLLTESKNIFSAGSLVPVIKAAMRRLGDESGKSRDEIVDAMNAISLATGKRLTGGKARGIHRDTLDKWLNPEEAEHVPGLFALHVFCLALESPSPLLAWLSLLGGGVEIMTVEDRRLREPGGRLADGSALHGYFANQYGASHRHAQPGKHRTRVCRLAIHLPEAAGHVGFDGCSASGRLERVGRAESGTGFLPFHRHASVVFPADRGWV